MKRKYNAGDHNSSININLFSTLVKTKKRHLENQQYTISYHWKSHIVKCKTIKFWGEQLVTEGSFAVQVLMPLLVLLFQMLAATQWILRTVSRWHQQTMMRSRAPTQTGKTKVRLKLLLEIDKWALAHQRLSKLTHSSVWPLLGDIIDRGKHNHLWEPGGCERDCSAPISPSNIRQSGKAGQQPGVTGSG